MRDSTSPGLRSSEMSLARIACLSRASWSSRSKMLNAAGNPARGASRRRRRAEVAWKVPTQSAAEAAGPTRARIRSVISLAALLVKVKARMPEAGTPPSPRRWAIRRVSTRVLPEPAPAMTRSGPSPWVTAACWASLRSVATVVTLARRLELGGQREVVLGLAPAIQVVRPGHVELEQQVAQVRARSHPGRQHEVLGGPHPGDRVLVGQAQVLVVDPDHAGVGEGGPAQVEEAERNRADHAERRDEGEAELHVGEHRTGAQPREVLVATDRRVAAELEHLAVLAQRAQPLHSHGELVFGRDREVVPPV